MHQQRFVKKGGQLTQMSITDLMCCLIGHATLESEYTAGA